ncbi:uncharacterized protein SOCE26_078510 [Sorangium cellulosum]|uniref:Secreted protein n=1 Tax=Sorangium cellulosum TaxID=56 RepID=A0A2L0F448_SORCE|nr:hypothetical protein [Sorangium cellulosum]AUX46345.1 uncharacterized protein SOCE26_078510 [Sorangium cellulosum]
MQFAYRYISLLSIAGSTLLAGCSTEVDIDDPLVTNDAEQGVTVEPDACKTGVVGDGVTCEDPGVLKDTANALCVEAGLSLSDFQYDAYGEDGCDWRTREAKFTCCASSEPPPVDPPPVEPGPDPSCKSGVVGDGVTCEDPGALKDEAYAICVAAGLELGLFDAWSVVECGGYAIEAKFTCCPKAPAP